MNMCVNATEVVAIIGLSLQGFLRVEEASKRQAIYMLEATPAK